LFDEQRKKGRKKNPYFIPMILKYPMMLHVDVHSDDNKNLTRHKALKIAFHNFKEFFRFSFKFVAKLFLYFRPFFPQNRKEKIFLNSRTCVNKMQGYSLIINEIKKVRKKNCV